MSEQKKAVPRRIAQTVVNSLKGGVVPRIGLPYITVGRKLEIQALLHDVDSISAGGSSFRFIVGRYGAGKSFLLQTLRNYAMDKGFIVMDADLSPERKLHGSSGQGLATYRELVANLSTKTKPEGGALTLILDRWISAAETKAATENGLPMDDPAFSQAVDKEILAVTSSLGEMVHGFDFARLLSSYYHAYLEGNDEKKDAVVRWFRGEYETKREARQELGVNIIITDDDWYDYLKLFALFFRLAGYQGMLVMVDELINIAKIPNSQSRQYNYEKLLAMYNDALQGKARYIGFLMGATPETLEDRRRGIYSYEALRSRLTEGRFSQPGARDLLAPVIRLDPLSPEEMVVLCADIHSGLYGYQSHIGDREIAAFIKLEYERIGSDQHITPREVIRDFIELLDLLYQHPDMRMESLLKSEDFTFAKSGAVDDEASGDYKTFSV